MIRFVANKDINKQKWDRCVSDSVNGIVYACSWYLDIVAPGWAALVEGDYKTVMPLPARKKFGVWYIFNPFFVQQLGVFGQECGSAIKVKEFLNAIPKQFKIIETNLNTHNKLEEWHQKDLGLTHHLQLIEPYEQNRKKFSENAIRNIKKAENRGIFVVSGGNPEVLIDAFKKTRGQELKKIKDSDYQTLVRLLYAALHKGQAILDMAYTSENSFCAGAVFFETFHKSIFLFSATTEEGKNHGAMFCIIDNYIKRSSGREIVLDFEGSKIPGLARFYKSFGSKECVFLQVRKTRLPLVVKPLLKLYKFLR